MRALFPPAAQTHDKGHGRREWRAIWVCPTDPWSTNFAGACQLLRIERHIWEGQAEKPRIEVVYGVTSLEATQGPPERLLALIRQHWGAIENGHHHRRDRTYREDNSPVRDPNATPSYAALRAVAIFLAGRSSPSSVSREKHTRNWRFFRRPKLSAMSGFGTKARSQSLSRSHCFLAAIGFFGR